MLSRWRVYGGLNPKSDVHLARLEQPFVEWYNEFRPHTYLDGCTPNEVALDLSPANQAPRLEPRSNWPRKSRCASPQAPVRGGPGAKFVLSVAFHGGRKHPPIVTLKEVA